MLSEYIYSLYDKGLMRDYSDNHFIIRAMTGQLDILKDYGHLLDTSFVNPSIDFSSTFLINFSNKLKRCATVFPERNIEIFVKDPLAAGKQNYNEATFFEALSEINVLLYFCNFVGVIKTALYEPRQGNGDTNPEAQFVFNDNTTINIEVKKANFSNSINRNSGINGAIKPNIALKEEVKDELEAFCVTNQLQLVYPRISKIGDFVASAGSKFQTHKTHIIIMFYSLIGLILISLNVG